MRNDPGTLHASQGSNRCIGVISGFALKLIRESVNLTQTQLAERHGVDVASIQGWESARRPLTALRAAGLMRLRSRLLRSGAQPRALNVLHDSIQADLIIADAVAAGAQTIESDQHALGVAVHDRRLTELITWPFTGEAPQQLRSLPSGAMRRRGPVPDRPTLASADRTRFFDHLLVTADANQGEDLALLRRQAVYLLAFDPRPSTAQWLHDQHARALSRHTDHPPSWASVRSSAVALAYSGDSDPLRFFVRRALRTDRDEHANLNYWAYWVGEIDTLHVDDNFMFKTDPRTWRGTGLLNHLLRRLRPGSSHGELNIHTLWALIAAHPDLLSDQLGLGSQVLAKVETLAADGHLAAETRRELSDISYAVRLARG